MPAASVILASLIGFRFYGLNGACSGGAAAWIVAAFVALSLRLSADNNRAQDTEDAHKQRSLIVDTIDKVRDEVASVRRLQAGRGDQKDYRE